MTLQKNKKKTHTQTGTQTILLVPLACLPTLDLPTFYLPLFLFGQESFPCLPTTGDRTAQSHAFQSLATTSAFSPPLPPLPILGGTPMFFSAACRWLWHSREEARGRPTTQRLAPWKSDRPCLLSQPYMWYTCNHLHMFSIG
jgi:hypothetical protein